MTTELTLSLGFYHRTDAERILNWIGGNWTGIRHGVDPAGHTIRVDEGNRVYYVEQDKLGTVLKPFSESAYLLFGRADGGLSYSADGQSIDVDCGGWAPFDVEDSVVTYHNINEFLKKAIPALEPDVAIVNSSTYTYPDEFEYYSDSRYFATPWFEYYKVMPYPFMFHQTNSLPVVKAEIDEASSLISSAEVKSIVRKIAPVCIEHKDGIGAWFFDPEDRESFVKANESLFPPTYYVRKELIKRKAKLYFGPCEEHLASSLGYGAKYLSELLDLGVLDDENYNRLLNAYNEFKKQNPNPEPGTYWARKEELEKRLLAALSEEKRHELGLDLPKPPESLVSGG